MPDLPHVFEALHAFVLAGFVLVTFLLLIVTVASRMRVRDILLTWRHGRRIGIPLWPTCFMALVVVMFAYSWHLGNVNHPVVYGSYLLGGVFWFVSSFISSTVIVTKQGLLLNEGTSSRAVAWVQVEDYFETERQGEKRFVLFFVDDDGNRSRAALQVPQAYSEAFAEVVRAHLDVRFELSVPQAWDKKALEE